MNSEYTDVNRKIERGGTSESWHIHLIASYPRPEEAKEEKGPGFSCSCMCIIISYLSTCIHGRAREKCSCCHMVSLLTSIVYSEVKERGYFFATITMSVINACLWTLVRNKNSVALFSTTGYRINWQTELYIYWNNQQPTTTPIQLLEKAWIQAKCRTRRVKLT